MQSQTITVKKKELLCPDTFTFDLELSEPVQYFPGQFVVLQIEPKIFRSYSIVALNDNRLTLLIDVRIGGPASKFFKEAKPGTTLNLIGKPLGRFIIHDRPSPKAFIATGTGLAPFVPMIKTVLEQDPKATVDLFFGIRNIEHDYPAQFFQDCLTEKNPNFRIHHCISQPEDELPEAITSGTSHSSPVMFQ